MFLLISWETSSNGRYTFWISFGRCIIGSYRTHTYSKTGPPYWIIEQKVSKVNVSDKKTWNKTRHKIDIEEKGLFIFFEPKKLENTLKVVAQTETGFQIKNGTFSSESILLLLSRESERDSNRGRRLYYRFCGRFENFIEIDMYAITVDVKI